MKSKKQIKIIKEKHLWTYNKSEVNGAEEWVENKIKKIEENNNKMSWYEHKIKISQEGIEHLSKEKKEEKERKCRKKNHYYNPLIL